MFDGESSEKDDEQKPRALFLDPALKIVFKDFTVHELNEYSKTCTYWRNAIQRFICNRKTPDLLFVRDFCDAHMDHDFDYRALAELGPTQTLCNHLMIYPKMCFILCKVVNSQVDKYMYMRHAFTQCQKGCFKHKEQLPIDCYIVLVSVFSAHLRTPINYVPINSIFLPNITVLTHKVHTLTYEYARTLGHREIPEHMMDKFINDRDDDCGLILLENRLYGDDFRFEDHNYLDFRQQFFQKLSIRYKRGLALWGGRASIYRTDPDDDDDDASRPFFTGIRFSGSNMRAWSINLSSYWSDKQTTRERLKRFRDRVRLKSQNLGLHLYTHEIKSDVKAMLHENFPVVRFVHIILDESTHFVNNNEELASIKENVFVTDSTDFVPNPTLKHMDYYTAVLIVTYD